MRRIGYLRWFAPMAAAFLLSGCAILNKQELRPLPPTLSHAQLVVSANAWCKRDLRRTRKLKRPKNAQMVVRQLGIATNSLGHLIFHLRRLPPPPSDAVAYQQLLATANNEQLVATHLMQAIEQGRIHFAKNHAKRLVVVDKRFNARATALGMDECAKG